MFKVSYGLTFPGTCEEAFTFYKSVFEAEFNEFIRFKDDPYTDATTAGKDKSKVAYVEMPLGNILLTGDDTLESSGIKLVSGNMACMTIEPDNKKEADRIFGALSQGGEILNQIADFPWGYCGTVIDKFGVKWGVWYKPPQTK